MNNKESVVSEIALSIQKDLRFPIRKDALIAKEGGRAIEVKGRAVPLANLLEVVPMEEFPDQRAMEAAILENWILAEAGHRPLARQ